MLNPRVLKCELCQITFQQAVDQVPDWDDRHRTVKWVDVEKALSPQRPGKKKVSVWKGGQQSMINHKHAKHLKEKSFPVISKNLLR